MSLQFAFNAQKNEWLKATRGVGFENILAAIAQGNLLGNIAHPSRKYPKQRLFLVKIDKYVYVVPYVYQKTKQEIFLKTLYPSRVMTKHYLHRKETHVKTNT